jgi:hypothetical protein
MWISRLIRNFWTSLGGESWDQRMVLILTKLEVSSIVTLCITKGKVAWDFVASVFSWIYCTYISPRCWVNTLSFFYSQSYTYFLMTTLSTVQFIFWISALAYSPRCTLNDFHKKTKKTRLKSPLYTTTAISFLDVTYSAYFKSPMWPTGLSKDFFVGCSSAHFEPHLLLLHSFNQQIFVENKRCMLKFAFWILVID